MFCTKCGARIQEGAKFCIHCGNPVAGGAVNNPETVPVAGNPVAGEVVNNPEAVPAAGNPMAGEVVNNPETVPYAGNPVAGGTVNNPGGVPYVGNPVINRTGNGSGAKPNRRKLYMIGALALIAVVIFAITSLFRGSGAGLGSPEEALEAYLNGYWEHDFDRMLEAYPDFRIKADGGRDRLKETIQRNYDVQIAEYVDAGYLFTYRAIGHTILDRDEAERVEQDVNDTFGVDVSFSAVATVEYQMIMNYEGTEKISSMTGGYAVKYKGKWYFFNVL